MEYNPFSLLFGKEPTQMIARAEETDKILSAFCREPSVSQAYMITGIRGCGKTVFMTEISARLAEQKNWVVVELNPEHNLLEDFASKLSSNNVLARMFRNAKINLSFFGFGVDIRGTAAITSIEVALIRMLESLKKHGKKVLVTIDEVSTSAAMREFAHAFQIFIRRDLPLYLLMTGLHENIEALQNEKNLTFLYRAPKIALGALSIRSIAIRYEDVFHLDKKQAEKMADMTKGYPFAFQVLGYFTWESEGDYKGVLRDYQRYLADYSYDKIWTELSAGDRKVLYGIARTESGRIVDIRETLQMDTNHFNPYRMRLIKKGILNGAEYGMVLFTLPCFREYVLENWSGE